MMALVRIALKRPYTFVVMSLLIAVLGIGSIFTMPTDIFPPINDPAGGAAYNLASPSSTATFRILTAHRKKENGSDSKTGGQSPSLRVEATRTAFERACPGARAAIL